MIAAFASWHDQHDLADERIGNSSRLISHVAAETLSTLTRLPNSFRVEAQPVWEFLTKRFTAPWIVPTARQSRSILARAVERGISGGAVCESLVAGLAAAAGGSLLSLDRRAERTYRELGASFEMLGSTAL